MKRRTSWLAMSSLVLVVGAAFIGSVKFYAQIQRPEVNPRSSSVEGDRKHLPGRLEDVDPKIIAIMRRQEELEPAANALQEEAMKSDSGYTSLAYEGDGLALHWKGELNNDMLAAINKAREACPVEIIPAAFSMAEMKAEAEKIHKASLKDGGSDIQSVIYRPDGSGLDIERMPLRAAENIAMARARAGKRSLRPVEQVLAGLDLRVPIRVTTADKQIEFMADRFNDSPPWNGGGYWEARDLYTARIKSRCTTGFGIRAYGRNWVLTAAHCATAPDANYQGCRIPNPYDVFDSGKSVDNNYCLGSQDWMGPVREERYEYDLMLIDAPGYHRMFDGPRNNNGYYKNVYGWGYYRENELVCQSGARSGVVCGIKTLYSQDWQVPPPGDSDGDSGYWVRGLIRTYQTELKLGIRQGDSGGPVFTLMDNGVRAKGIASASIGGELAFQDWHDVIRLYNGYPVTP